MTAFLKNLNTRVEKKLIPFILEYFFLFGVVGIVLIMFLIFGFIYWKVENYFSLLTAFVASFAALITLFTFVTNFKTSTIRHYSNFEAALLDLERDNLKILQKYRVKEPRTSEQGEKPRAEEYKYYSMVARKAFHLCNQIFSESLWKQTIRHHFISLFERVRSQYWDFLKANKSEFDDDFFRYMKNAEWRALLNPRKADQLRWIYEADLFERIVLSPLHPDLRDRLLEMISDTLERIFREKDARTQKTPSNVDKGLVIADLGCGKGALIGELIKKEWTTETGLYKIEKAYCIDYSPSMLRVAEDQLCGNESRVEIKNADLCDLSEFARKFDIIFSINSILPRDPDDMPIMLKQCALTLKKDGLLIAILPSFDTVLELKDLDEKRECLRLQNEDGMNEAEAEKVAKATIDHEYIKKRKLDTEKYLYADDNMNPQRFFSKLEIPNLLEKYDLELEKIERFTYPWNICKQFNYGDHDGKEAVYDWYVVARKTK